MAATTDQAAFILSIPRRKMIDETQETLRTSAFPSTHVKVTSLLHNLACFLFALIFLKSFKWNIYKRSLDRIYLLLRPSHLQDVSLTGFGI